MIYNDVKNKVNNLFPLYVTGKHKEKCIDELFILIYYNPRCFTITMKDETLNDFHSTLYPKVLENIFSKYDETKSNFFTFVCLCLKNHARAFLRELYRKNAIDDVLLKEITNDESINRDDFSFQNNSLELDINECDSNIKYEEHNMEKELSDWILETNSLQSKKNYRKAIFILSCKIAYLIDEKMLKAIADYIEISEDLLRYYISKLNLIHAISSNAKKILEAKNQRDKYFVKKKSIEALLSSENLSESRKNTLKCSKEYSIQKYKIACKRLKTEKQIISNRTIAKVTGISRSMIDRILINISNILQYSPSIDEK